MNRFALLTKGGEIVNVYITHSLQEAITYFSITKKLDGITLLEIYDVKKLK